MIQCRPKIIRDHISTMLEMPFFGTMACRPKTTGKQNVELMRHQFSSCTAMWTSSRPTILRKPQSIYASGHNARQLLYAVPFIFGYHAIAAFADLLVPRSTKATSQSAFAQIKTPSAVQNARPENLTGYIFHIHKFSTDAP